MRDSNVADAAKESAQAEFPHGLIGFAQIFLREIVAQSEHELVRRPAPHAI
jgi:hypothetical protein